MKCLESGDCLRRPCGCVICHDVRPRSRMGIRNEWCFNWSTNGITSRGQKVSLAITTLTTQIREQPTLTSGMAVSSTQTLFQGQTPHGLI